MNNEELLATATAKSAAHTGLADALESGHVSLLRVDGVDHLTARADDDHFLVTFDAAGTAYCRGFVLGGSAAPLALDAYRAARDLGPHSRA